MACDNQGNATAAGYAVIIRINGINLNGMNLSRQFDARSPEACTLTGHAVVELNAGDVITVHLVPLSPKRFMVDALSARLNVKMEPWF